jgi:phosphopantetheinyl transferase (holo-ACP synthase)
VVARCLKTLLILGASVTAGAQTQAAERASIPQRGSEKYWMLLDELADRAIHFAYAKRFVHLHEGSVTDRQCQQYSRMAADYADKLAVVKQVGLSAQTGFWNDVRVYSTSMIGAPGVPIPGRRTGMYWVTTGLEAEDDELRRVVSLEIDEASAQLIPTGGYPPSALIGDCRTDPRTDCEDPQR